MAAAHRLLFDVPETAEALNVSRATVYRLIERGELHSVSIGSRRLVPRFEVLDFVDRIAAEGVAQ
jgi:excisionase family DNA binding protein